MTRKLDVPNPPGVKDRSPLWLPLIVAAALLVGAGLYYLGHRMSAAPPKVHAESGAVTK